LTHSVEVQSRIDAGEVLVLDGAMGSELERLGAPMHYDIWCAAALGSHPELVRQVHRNYIEAGADIITTNTYASARHALERGGMGDKVHEWNSLAAQLALEARNEYSGPRSIYVAGAVSNFGNWRTPGADRLRNNYGELASILADNGADVILLEMLAADVEETLPAVEASADCGLPVWVGLSSAIDRESGKVMLGIEESQEHSENSTGFEPLDGAVRKLMAAGGSALLVMHSDLKTTAPALSVCKDNYDGTLGAYANAGYWQRPNWTFVDQVSPDKYGDEAMDWVAMGAQIVGGCCGIGPDHIKAIRDRVPEPVT
jgi:methionine synthase I (cobalamin-dependent)